MHEDPRAERAVLSSAEAYRLVEEARQMRAERDAHAAQVEGLRAEVARLKASEHVFVIVGDMLAHHLEWMIEEPTSGLVPEVLDVIKERAAQDTAQWQNALRQAGFTRPGAALDSAPAGATGDGHPDLCRAVHESGRRCEREAGHTQADPRHYALGMSTAWTDAAPTA